jgi:outer membrane protein assembly factor BamD
MNEKDIVKETPKVQWEYAQGLEKNAKYNNAAHAYQALIKAFPTSPYAPQAQLKIAECHEKNGDLYEAFKAYEKMLDNYPKDANYEDILKRENRIGELYIKGKKRNLWRFPIIPAVDKGIEILEAIIKNAPYSAIAPQAQFMVGTAYKRQGKYTEAITAYEKILKDYTDTPWYEEALYQVGWCNYKKSRGFSYDQLSAKEAVVYFERFISEFPQSKHTEKTKQMLNELSHRQGKGILEIAHYYDKHHYKEAAIMYYKDIVEKFPETEEAQIAEKRLKILEK